jgi:uncharacterized protein (DUF1800 family)
MWLHSSLVFAVAGSLALLSSSAVSAQISSCPFNADGTGTTADALRDGILLVRYARGMRGADLVAETNATATAVEANVAANIARLDVNASGAFDTADALIIMRVLLGYNTGTLLPVGTPAAGKFATRDTDAAVKTYLDGGCTSTPLAEQQAASRFLTQATYGTKRADITSFVALAGSGPTTDDAVKRKARTWINNQTAIGVAAKHFDYVNTPPNGCLDQDACKFSSKYARHSFWQQALTRDDQLRQRMAFALSEIFVVSTNSDVNNPFQVAAYMDLMSANALGNYRDLLESVVRSPAMGVFLSHIRNNGASETPNENFAREVLQLFSVGLVPLNVAGVPIGTTPTYDEDTVRGFARIFTGLSYDDQRTAAQKCPDGRSDTIPNFFWSPTASCAIVGSEKIRFDMAAFARPMIIYPGYHSNKEKRLLQYDTATAASPDLNCTAARIDASKLLPAIAPEAGVTNGTRVSTATGNVMLSRAIDNIFCHPNVGPFISEQLIRFFVTSTPSPEYVSRVSAVFNDNGNINTSTGRRGDLKAVITAILLDEEAIKPDLLSDTAREKFGKLKEPIMRFSGVLRAFPHPTIPGHSGRRLIEGINSVESGIAQGPYQSPSVFNFFHPEFSPPGPIKNANAFGPEFEITTTTSIAATQNTLGTLITRRPSSASAYADYGVRPPSEGACTLGAAPEVTTDCIFLDFTDLQPMALDANMLLDYANLVLMGGRLPASVKANYATAINTAYPVLDTPARKRERISAALWLAAHSPEFQIQY